MKNKRIAANFLKENLKSIIKTCNDFLLKNPNEGIVTVVLNCKTKKTRLVAKEDCDFIHECKEEEVCIFDKTQKELIENRPLRNEIEYNLLHLDLLFSVKRKPKKSFWQRLFS